jgi:hypothetical protein
MKKLLAVALFAACALAQDVAGHWQLAMDTPHGPMKGSLDLNQDHSKITGTLDLGPMGSFSLKGTVDEAKIAFDIELPDNSGTLKFTGSLESGKMSGTTDPHNFAWSATRPTVILGTITGFRDKTLEFALKADSGGATYFKVAPDTQVLRIPPGESDLAKAQPAAVTDLAIGDRVLVSFVSGMDEPRRIVRMSPVDIEKRNQAERLDWQQRGISGIVSGKTGDTVALDLRSMEGSHTIQIVLTPKTTIRRYAPDSVKFSDARPSSIADISPGDQLRARGTKSADGASFTAEDIVFGTFLTVLGPVTAIDRGTGEVHVNDLVSKSRLTIRITADSRLRKMPDMHEMFAQMMKAPQEGPPTHDPGGIAQTIERMPACTIADLKPGGTVIVTATRGARPDTVTAIMLVANIDGLIQMAQAQSGGESMNPVEAIARMHHGMLDGPGGSLSLPALLP